VSKSWPPPGIAPVDYSAQISSTEAISKRMSLVEQMLTVGADAAMRGLPGWDLARGTFATSMPADVYQRNVPLVR
jgi:hypothetical protein